MHLEKYTCSAAPVCRLVLFPRFSAPCSFFFNFIFTIFNQVFDWRIFFATQVGTSQSSPVLVLIFANSFSALGLAASLIFHIFKSTSSWKNLVFFFLIFIFSNRLLHGRILGTHVGTSDFVPGHDPFSRIPDLFSGTRDRASELTHCDALLEVQYFYPRKQHDGKFSWSKCRTGTTLSGSAESARQSALDGSN